MKVLPILLGGDVTGNGGLRIEGRFALESTAAD